MTLSPYYSDERVTLLLGDSLDVLATLPEASVDAVITDPPYGLADHHPAVIAQALAAWLGGDRTHMPAGKGFMGKDWDRFVPPPAVWDECLRVLKPGGHLIAFAGARTLDLMMLSIRLAGFEIRDGLSWIYGSGMPKGQAIAKAVDRRRDDRERVLQVTAWLAAARDIAGWTNARIDALWGFHGMAGLWTTQGKAAIVPRPEQWARLRAEIGFDDAEIRHVLDELNSRKGTLGDAWNQREVIGHRTVSERKSHHLYGDFSGDDRVTAPASDPARQWQGWNTQLKPAHEPIVWAHKPFNPVSLDVWLVSHVHHALGGLVWLSLAPAKRAELSSQSRSHGLGEAGCVSALVSAALTTSPDVSARTATFSSLATASTCSNIAGSWSAILDALSDLTRTSTTSTASSTTTGLKTLSSLLGPITSPTTMPQCGCLLDGDSSPAKSAANSSSDDWWSWIDTLSHSVPATAIEGTGLAVSSALASVAEELSSGLAEESTAPWDARTGHPMTFGDSPTGSAKAADAGTSPAGTLDGIAHSGAQGAPRPGSAAHEPIILARKSTGFNTTVANVLRHGTGALNIDSCRTAGVVPVVPQSRFAGSNNNIRTGGRSGELSEAHNAGRWPTNIVLSHDPDCIEGGDCQPGCAVAEMDRQSGLLKSGANPTRRRSDKFRDTFGTFSGQSECAPGRGADSGGASRFFPVFRYAAKAPASERPRLPDGTAHPTVKPLALMRWLVRLVTPPGGTILDPFAGTGTTLEAASAEGFHVLGIEQHQPYADLSVLRLSRPNPMTLFGDVS